MLKSENKRIKRYPIEDLETITMGDGGNAYQSAEEWHTDPDQSNADGSKKMRLVCIEKWWRGKNVSIQSVDSAIKCIICLFNMI